MSVKDLQARVCEYSRRHRPANREQDLVIMYLEEVDGRCNLLNAQVLQAIETWTDVVPEDAARATIVNELTSLAAQRDGLQHQLEELTGELANSKQRSDEQVKALKTQIQNKEKQLADANKRLTQLSEASTYSFPSGSRNFTHIYAYQTNCI